MKNRFKHKEIVSEEAQSKSSKTKKNTTTKSSDDSIKSWEFMEWFLGKYSSIRKSTFWKKCLFLSLIVLFCLFSAFIIFSKIFSHQISELQLLKLFQLPQKGEAMAVEQSADIAIFGRGGMENDAPDLIDTIILTYLNQASSRIVTLSIPRDLLVQSSILWKVKINEIYSGVKRSQWHDIAIRHLLDILSQISGRNIDMYAMVDFEWFRKIIDAVWWIEVFVEDRLYDPQYPTKNWWYTVIDIPAWVQVLDGDKALKFARSRHSTSDFDRSNRQQLVIDALRGKLLNLDILSSPKKMEEIYGILGESIDTNLKLSDLFVIVKNYRHLMESSLVNYTLNVSCFEAIRLCESGGLLYNPPRDMHGGLSVLLPKKISPTFHGSYEDIRTYILLIYWYPNISSLPGVGVVNASGKTNGALNVAFRLKSIGIPVDEKGIKNQKEKVELSFIRYNSDIVQSDHEFFRVIQSIFVGEIRSATDLEKAEMKSPYEIVLGNNSSQSFK